MYNKSLKKLIAILVLGVMLLPHGFSAYAQNEAVRYIVILNEPAIYSSERPMFFSSYDERYKNELREALTSLQSEIKSMIKLPMTLNFENQEESDYSFTDVLNGFTITTDAETAEQIKSIEGVKDVFPDSVIAQIPYMQLLSDEENQTPQVPILPETETVSLADAGNVTNTHYAYEKGYSGEGKTIAVLDSTLYYDNTFFALTDNSKAKYTKESLNEIFSQKGMKFSIDDAYRNQKVPFAYDYEAASYTLKTNVSQHGTHVSGIAAGNKTMLGDGILRGAAPEAQILFFGVASNSGGVSFSVAAKAVDDAVKLGADAINMSFGEDFVSENSTAKSHVTFRTAVENAENAGCFVSVSGGNAGRGNITNPKNYDYSSSDNNLFPSGVSVGSVHNNYRVARKLTDENENHYAAEARSSVYEFSLTQIVDCSYGTLQDIENVDLTGKIAVIKKPEEPFAEEDDTYYTRVKSKGAEGLILIYNIDQVKDTWFFSSNTMPFFIMTKSDGERLLLNATKIKCEKRLMIAKNSDMPRVSNFSSYGFSDSLDITIDFSAPGGNIYSAFNDVFLPMSGTSMASPHIAGAGVLMSEYIEENYPQYTEKSKVKLIENLLASTAQNVYEENGALASVRKAGSGVIQIDKAMQTKVILHNAGTESRITLGDKIGKEFTLSFYAENISDTLVTFDKADIEISSDDFKYYSEKDAYYYNGIKKINAAFQFSPVTVNPYSSEKVSITVTLDDEDVAYLSTAMINGFFVDGKVTLSSSGESHVDVGIPFTGFYGDWAKIDVLDESLLKNNLEIYSDTGDCRLYCNIETTDDGYKMPFTSLPDEIVGQSPLSLSMLIKRNTFAKITFEEEELFNGFIKKNSEVIMKEFLKSNSILSDKLKTAAAEIEISFTLPLNKGKESDQIIHITVVSQNDKPVIKEAYVEETNGSRIMKMELLGNEISTVLRKGHNKSGNSSKGSITVRKAHQIIGDNVSNLADASYYVYDSAFNMTSLEHDIKIEMQDDKAIFKNTTINDIKGLCIIAVYSDDGKMEKVSYLCEKDTVFKAYKNLEVDVSEYKGENYKLFFWKSSDSLEPLCEAY